MADDKKQKAKEVAAENGVLNPGGAVVLAAAPMYLALIPLTYVIRHISSDRFELIYFRSYLTNADSTVQKLGETLINLIPGVASSSMTSGRAIPALSAIYLFWTFGASGAASAAGQAMAREEGLDNNHPRKHTNNLNGLPLRLRSAHYALMENFPAFALAAALAQIIAPADVQVANLLTYHVIAKLLVHYPAYLANLALPRTLAHISATSALINVCWRLAAGS
ncbi:MAG: hypothetical protein GOMPHAMPRED_001757 [Gomphillus americanus]|uniref:MAPEG family protein n=1 Tax=Gomphillus americanus TaxID=1940652 RepID=A0A8H3F7F8_9LECA|nr:MAG: hypothetical protein GOMPHAMPRED_001757 [Gomphillus americanus]